MIQHSVPLGIPENVLQYSEFANIWGSLTVRP